MEVAAVPPDAGIAEKPSFEPSSATHEAVLDLSCCPAHLIRKSVILQPLSALDSIPALVHIKKLETAIGRERNAVDVHLDSARVPRMISRVHSYLVYSHHQWKVRDNRSVNGVFVNDRKVHEAALRDGDIVVFGGGGNRPIGAIFEQRESEFKYEFRSSHWNPLLLSADDESEEEDDTVNGEDDLERQADDTQDVGMFDLEPVSPSSSVAPGAQTSAMDDTQAGETQPTGEEPNSNPKKRKKSSSPGADSPEEAESSTSATLPLNTSDAMPLAETVEWPAGPVSKKPFRGQGSSGIGDSLDLAPELSNDSTGQVDTEIMRRKRGVLGLAREKEASERETIEATIADVEARLAEPIDDEEAERRLSKLQADLFEACEHRKTLKPIYPVPEDSPLHCKFCENMMFNPTIMGCGHSLCDGCVECLVIEKPECPVCSLPITLPIQPNSALQTELMTAIVDWTPEQRQDWVSQMTKRNEKARTAELELMLESVRVRGIRFLQITERWKDHDRVTFAEGIDIYSASSRLSFCRAVGLTPEWIAQADMNQLIVALGNLGIPLTPLVNRTKHVDGARPLLNILNNFRDGLTYFIHHNRRHVAQQQYQQAQQQLQQQLQQAQQQVQQHQNHNPQGDGMAHNVQVNLAAPLPPLPPAPQQQQQPPPQNDRR